MPFPAPEWHGVPRLMPSFFGRMTFRARAMSSAGNEDITLSIVFLSGEPIFSAHVRGGYPASYSWIARQCFFADLWLFGKKAWSETVMFKHFQVDLSLLLATMLACPIIVDNTFLRRATADMKICDVALFKEHVFPKQLWIASVVAHREGHDQRYNANDAGLISGLR